MAAVKWPAPTIHLPNCTFSSYKFADFTMLFNASVQCCEAERAHGRATLFAPAIPMLLDGHMTRHQLSTYLF